MLFSSRVRVRVIVRVRVRIRFIVFGWFVVMHTYLHYFPSSLSQLYIAES